MLKHLFLEPLPDVLWALFLIASFTDLYLGKIYNWLTFGFLGLGLLSRLGLGGSGALENSFTSLLVAALLFFPLWLVRVFSAGDVKLLMAASSWLSLHDTVRLAFFSVLVGAFVGIIVMVGKRLRRGGGEEKVLTRIPFAPAFLCAFLLMHIAQLKQWDIL